MKTIKFTAYLFYRYYSKGPRARIPYFSTICALSMLGFLHLFQLLLIFDSVPIIPINSSDDKLTKRFIMLFVFIPLYLIMTRVFKKTDIEPLKEKYDKDWDRVFKGNVWLVVYIILSMGLIGLIAYLKN